MPGGAGRSGLRLGLYISRQIVVTHGGTIRVESSEKKRTRFVVELPRRSSESADPDRTRLTSH